MICATRCRRGPVLGLAIVLIFDPLLAHTGMAEAAAAGGGVGDVEPGFGAVSTACHVMLTWMVAHPAAAWPAEALAAAAAAGRAGGGGAAAGAGEGGGVAAAAAAPPEVVAELAARAAALAAAARLAAHLSDLTRRRAHDQDWKVGRWAAGGREGGCKFPAQTKPCQAKQAERRQWRRMQAIISMAGGRAAAAAGRGNGALAPVGGGTRTLAQVPGSAAASRGAVQPVATATDGSHEAHTHDFVCSLQCILYRFPNHRCNPPHLYTIRRTPACATARCPRTPSCAASCRWRPWWRWRRAGRRRRRRAAARRCWRCAWRACCRRSGAAAAEAECGAGACVYVCVTDWVA